MDFGKFKYQEAKRAARSQAEAEADSGQGSEVPPRHRRGDYQIKLRNLIKFLQEGDKAKVTLRFRGAKWRTRNSACACWSESRRS
jgi:translation initiation factor IF-3